MNKGQSEVRFVKIISISLFSQAFVLLAGFINSIIITRHLGPEGRGQYALTMGIITIFSLILGDGLYRSNTYLVSVNRKHLSRLISNSILALVIFCLVLFCMLFMLNDALIEKILPGIDFSLILIAVISVIPLIMIRGFTGLFLGLQNYMLFNVLVASPIALYCLLNLTLFFRSGFTPQNILINYLVAMATFAVAAFMLMNRVEPYRFCADRALAKKSLVTGLKSNASMISLFLLFRVDIFLINYFLGTGAAGLYSIAVLLSELLQKLANTSGTVIFPKIAGDKTADKGKQLSLYMLLFVLIAGILFAAVLYLFGEKIIILLYSDMFTPSARPLYWLLPGTVIMALGKIILFSLWGRGFPRITFVAPLSAFFLNIILNVLLIPRLGLTGAAISTSVSYVLFGLSMGIYFFFSKDKNRRETVSEIEELGEVS